VRKRRNPFCGDGYYEIPLTIPNKVYEGRCLLCHPFTQTEMEERQRGREDSQNKHSFSSGHEHYSAPEENFISFRHKDHHDAQRSRRHAHPTTAQSQSYIPTSRCSENFIPEEKQWKKSLGLKKKILSVFARSHPLPNDKQVVRKSSLPSVVNFDRSKIDYDDQSVGMGSCS